ncbi:hypothetical protein ACUODF_56195, partial [Escherichia coli]
MLKALNAIEIGQRETDIGALLNDEGQTPTVVTIAATGQRFEYANMYPTARSQIRPIFIVRQFVGIICCAGPLCSN